MLETLFLYSLIQKYKQRKYMRWRWLHTTETSCPKTNDRKTSAHCADVLFKNRGPGTGKLNLLNLKKDLKPL